MLHRLRARAMVACSLILPLATPALAGDIALSDAKIEGGMLVVSGTTAAPNMRVRLDGQIGSEFNLTSGANRTFTFRLVYHPGDCIITLQKLMPPATLGAQTDGLVANCGRDTLIPRGAWSGSAVYSLNDLVTYEGSTWRARRANSGSVPEDDDLWELFAAAGGTEDNQARRSDTPIGPAGGELAGNYPNPRIANNVIDSGNIIADTIAATDIANGAIGPDELVGGAVIASKIAVGAVVTNRIGNLAVTTAKIADGAVNTAKIESGAVTNSSLGANSVDSSKVAQGSLTAIDLAGGQSNGTITLNAGYVANGRCRDFGISVPGAIPGDAMVFSIATSVPHGILFQGVRVSSDDIGVGKVCNFTGAVFPQLDNIQVAIITIRI